MRGIITLTTDFGLRDPFVAVMKGQILRRAPEATIVDVTHDVAPYQPAEAGFWLARIQPFFPDGTVHLAVVDPGVGTARRLLAVACGHQTCVAPDNGLLAELCARPGAVVREACAATFAAIGAAAAGTTFHGRDLLAPLAAELATGRLPFAAVGQVCVPVPGQVVATVRRKAGGLGGVVVTVDHFGNLLTNIDASDLAPGSEWTVAVGGRRARRVAAYGDAAAGELVALVNAWGLVEVAVAAGNAARSLGIGRGEPLFLHPHPAG